MTQSGRVLGRRPPLAALIVGLAIAVTGCAADWSSPHAAPTPHGSVGAGFLPSVAPTPAATITPAIGSWDDIHASSGMRIALLMSGHDERTQDLVAAVREWAKQDGADLRTVAAEGDPIDAIVSAVDMGADLIVSVGDDLVAPLAVVTAHHLDQEFLLVGSQLPEPTGNVTAVDGPATATPARGESVVRAGVAAVLHDIGGGVVWIE